MADLAKMLASLNVYVIAAGYAVILAILFAIFTAVKRTRPYRGQLMVLSAIDLMAALFFVLTFSFKVSKMATGATAATMPRALVVCLVPVSILCFVSILGKNAEEDAPFGPYVKKVLIVIVAIFVSVLLFKYIGYYLSSALFIALLMWLMEERRPLTLIGVPVCWCIFSYVVFARILFITLPIGSIWSSIL